MCTDGERSSKIRTDSKNKTQAQRERFSTTRDMQKYVPLASGRGSSACDCSVISF